MDTTSEVIDEPLTPAALGEMYRRMCEDPLYANIPGKIELDIWGRILMSPATPYHGKLQARLAHKLSALGGEVFTGPPIANSAGLLVPDVAWASPEFVSRQDEAMPFTRAPELCIEVASPSNSRKELNEKSRLISRPAPSKPGSCSRKASASSSTARTLRCRRRRSRST